MNAKQRKIIGIAACVLFVVLGAFVWLRIDAERRGEPLSYTQDETGGKPAENATASVDPPGSITHDPANDRDPSAPGNESGNGSSSPGDLIASGKTDPQPGTQSGTHGKSGDNTGAQSPTPAGQTDPQPGNTGTGQKTDPAGDNPGTHTDPAAPGENNTPGTSSGSDTPGTNGETDDPGNDGPGTADPKTDGPGHASETPGSLEDAQSLFSPVSSDGASGTKADDLIVFLKNEDGSFTRNEAAGSAALVGYAAGDCYEVKTVEGAALANLYYYFPTGAKNRRGDVIYNEAQEQPRMFAALRHLFPEHADDVCSDFVTMRHWEETYRSATGETEIPWSGYVRSRYYGTRYCRMAVSYNSLTVTVYPEGYSDTLGDFAADGTYREFYTYPAF